MNDAFILTREQAHALLLQRTGYQPFWVPALRKVGRGGWYDSQLAARTTRQQRHRLGHRYWKEMQSDADSVLAHLPANVTRFMDIGCGLAGIDLLLSRKLSDSTIVLLDQDRFEPRPHYGFRQVASAYNTLADTRSFLVTNGVDDQRIKTIDILTEPFPRHPSCDAIISIISWGFHYPIATYLDDAYALLNKGGVVVVDVRANTDGELRLNERFGAGSVREIPSPHRRIPRFFAVKQ